MNPRQEPVLGTHEPELGVLGNDAGRGTLPEHSPHIIAVGRMFGFRNISGPLGHGSLTVGHWFNIATHANTQNECNRTRVLGCAVLSRTAESESMHQTSIARVVDCCTIFCYFD